MARTKGLMISYDPNYRPTLWPDRQTAEKIIQDSFRHCHLAKVSEEELDRRQTEPETFSTAEVKAHLENL